MERKYYLRGLGLGIAVTAVIMGVLTSRDQTMTDQEIIARAKELGMVENTVLSKMSEEEDQDSSMAEDSENASDRTTVEDTGEETEDRETEIGEPAGTDKTQAGATTQSSTDKAQADAVAESSTDKVQEGDGTENGVDKAQADAETQDSADKLPSAAVKTVTISPGDGSHTVARKLAEAGVVVSADTFDEFLCRNGYDKRLITGTFSIPVVASDEQIARIVTGAE